MSLPALPRSLVFTLSLLLASTAFATPDKWAADINRFTTADAAHPPTPNAVVFVGSSSIRLWTTLGQDFPGVTTINRGFGGSELADSVFYADRIVIPYHPRLVVLFAGTNDIWAGKSPEAVAADFKAFRTKLHAALLIARWYHQRRSDSAHDVPPGHRRRDAKKEDHSRGVHGPPPLPHVR